MKPLAREHDGSDLVAGSAGFTIAEDGVLAPVRPIAAKRVEISHASEDLWRCYVPGDPYVSKA